MCKTYLYSTITKGTNVRHERFHVECKTTEEYKNNTWEPKI